MLLLQVAWLEIHFTFDLVFYLISLWFQVLRHSKNILPTLARLCLVSTFIEDGFRMFFQWNEQRDFMNMSWNCGYFLATVFVFFNLVAQLSASAMVLMRLRVPLACILLTSIIFVQVNNYCQVASTTITCTIQVCSPYLNYLFFSPNRQ